MSISDDRLEEELRRPRAKRRPSMRVSGKRVMQLRQVLIKKSTKPKLRSR